MRELKAASWAIAFMCVCGFTVAAHENTAAPAPPASVTAAPQPTGIDASPLQRRGSRYRLCASDVIAVTFPLTQEFNQTLSIQPDGFVSLAGAGDIHLEGLTTQESVKAIRGAYANILNDPLVTVDLKDFNKPFFTVGGQVNHPGKYDLRGPTSVTEAVAMAGGFNQAALHSQVLLFRRENDAWYEVKSLNLKKILRGHDLSEDTELRPGDMLYVPQNFISKAKKFIPSSGFGAYYQLHP
jgi:protein involved in polysaccharide export with SLBB domain